MPHILTLVLGCSAGLATRSIEWWEAACDGLGDSMSDVILASVASVNKLFAAVGSAASLDLAASRISQQLCVGLGPLLDTWRMMPGHAQVGAPRALVVQFWRAVMTQGLP